MRDDDEFPWDEIEAANENSCVARIARELAQHEMFDPPLPGSLLAGQVICQVPDSDVKYDSFLEWWFAVGRKLPDVTVDGWGAVSSLDASRGKKEAVPQEDWEALPESEREAIRKWADRIPIVLFYD